MKIYLIIGLIILLSLTACQINYVTIPKENMTCEQLKSCYDYNIGNCCLNWTNKPIKNWECNLYGEIGNKDINYLLEILKKCKEVDLK